MGVVMVGLFIIVNLLVAVLINEFADDDSGDVDLDVDGDGDGDGQGQGGAKGRVGDGGAKGGVGDERRAKGGVKMTARCEDDDLESCHSESIDDETLQPVATWPHNHSIYL